VVDAGAGRALIRLDGRLLRLGAVKAIRPQVGRINSHLCYAFCMAAARKQAGKPVKVTDEIAAIRCSAGDGVIREEVWKDEDGRVVRFNLAFINFHLFAGDNGRVLGYDTAHGLAHRHFAGNVGVLEPAPYDEIFDIFMAEVDTLRGLRKL